VGLVYPTLRTWRQSINSPPLELPLLPALIPLALNPVPSHLLRNHGRRHGCQPDIAPLLVRVFYQLADDPAERGGNSENLCPLVLFREIPFFLAVASAPRLTMAVSPSSRGFRWQAGDSAGFHVVSEVGMVRKFRELLSPSKRKGMIAPAGTAARNCESVCPTAVDEVVKFFGDADVYWNATVGIPV